MDDSEPPLGPEVEADPFLNSALSFLVGVSSQSVPICPDNEEYDADDEARSLPVLIPKRSVPEPATPVKKPRNNPNRLRTSFMVHGYHFPQVASYERVSHVEAVPVLKGFGGVEALRAMDIEERMDKSVVFAAFGTPMTTCSFLLDKNTARKAAQDGGRVEPGKREMAKGKSREFDPYAKETGEIKYYKKFLGKTWSNFEDGTLMYQPSLEHKVFETGKHGTHMAFPGILSSVIPFVKQSDITKENERDFCTDHISLHDLNISFPHLRKNKRRIVKLCRALKIDLSTAALASALVEKLVRTGWVTGKTLPLICAICLFLSIKFHDPYSQRKLTSFRTKIAERFRVNADLITKNEFRVYAKLEFGLFLDDNELMVYYRQVVEDDDDLSAESSLSSSSSSTSSSSSDTDDVYMLEHTRPAHPPS